MSTSKLLTSYAEDFVSFLIKTLPTLDNIKNIILFGSVAREEASKESDVDVFIELSEPDNKFQDQLNKLKNNFYESTRFKQYWILLGIDNEFNILSGTFDEWKELKNSIISNGIVLYGKFNSMPEGQNVLITSWEGIKPNSKRVYFNKKIFGYKQKKKQYAGLLQKHKGQKIGKGAIMIQIRAQKELQALFKKFNVKAKLLKVIAY